MIEIEDVSKQFDRILALDGVSAQIEENCIFGLVGTNGAGKSTLLRIISGVLHPDHGQVRIDGYPVWENPRAKGRLCFLADTAYFFANATPRSMGEYYRVIYPRFDPVRQRSHHRADIRYSCKAPEAPIPAFSFLLKR